MKMFVRLTEVDAGVAQNIVAALNGENTGNVSNVLDLRALKFDKNGEARVDLEIYVDQKVSEWEEDMRPTTREEVDPVWDLFGTFPRATPMVNRDEILSAIANIRGTLDMLNADPTHSNKATCVSFINKRCDKIEATLRGKN